ncbi:MAG: hypothetical protein ABFQ65_01995 [Nanoarchaeota archaeon]
MTNNLIAKIGIKVKTVKNIVYSTFLHPLQDTDINRNTGEIIKHYNSQKDSYSSKNF